jgi:hypothetical protein
MNQLGNEFNANQVPNKPNSPINGFENAKRPTNG